MNPAAAIPVSKLTEDQAVEELARIFDSAPDPDDVLAMHHWKQDNAGRAQQLEQHIARLQHRPADETAAAPAEIVNPQDAPPQHLQPDPTSSTGISPMEATMPKPGRKPKLTPQQRLDMAVTTARGHLDRARQAPADRKLRQKAHESLSGARRVARETGIPFPYDLVLPDLPDAHRGTKALEPEARPYEPPTAEQIQAHLPDGASRRLHEIAADLAVAIDREGHGPRATTRLRKKFRDLRHDLVPVLIGLELLTPNERAACEEDFQSFFNLALTAEILMGEPELAEGA